MTNPDMYEVEVQAGRSEPVPPYVSDWMLARWMGVTRPQLMGMPVRDVEEARMTMHAINTAQNAANGKAGR